MLQETTTSRMKPAVALEGISKSFPGVKALSGVSLALYPGSVTALIGENGAGKSTLVKILTGIYQPDGGTIRVAGTETHFPTALSAAHAGVTAIHQETVLFDELSVAENIFLGHAPRGRFGLIDWTKLNNNARDLLARVGANIDPTIRLRDLGIANKHMVAIARALSIDASVVIMDEPTAALSHKEIHELYELIDRLKADGKAILFISHKFDEIFRIADRYNRVSRWRHGRRGADCRCEPGSAGQDDGRAAMLARSSQGRCCHRRAGPDGFGLSPSDRIRRHQFRTAARRNPWLLRPDRRRPFRIHAVADRHHKSISRGDQVERRRPRHPLSRPKRSRPVSSMCRKSAAARAPLSACRSSRTSR